MTQTTLRLPRLNGNQLKILAAITMLIDHLGTLIFPRVYLLRFIGRLSYPLFAFMIAESAKYTKNKLKHFLMIFVLALLCQIVYYFFDNGSLYMSILVSFSFATICLYALEYFKKQIFDENAKWFYKILSAVLFLSAIIGTNVFCQLFQVDYGFYGCITPVLVNLFDFHQIPAPDKLKKLDNLYVRIFCLFVGLVLIGFVTYLACIVNYINYLDVSIFKLL